MRKVDIGVSVVYEALTALRFVHNIYGSLEISGPVCFRALLRASGSLAVLFISYTDTNGIISL